MLIIDDDFVDRFVEGLPQQELGVGDDGKVVPLSQHWVGAMVDEVFEHPDSSCERFSRFIKSNVHLFQEYARKAGERAGMTSEMQATFMLELIAIFSFKVAKKAHEEAIQRMKDGLE